MPKNNKAIMLTLHSIFGIIFAVLIIFLTIKVITLFINTDEDWQGSFNGLATLLEEEMPTKDPYSSENYLLKIEEDSLIIGLNPKVENPNGRLGDGDLHYAPKTFFRAISYKLFVDSANHFRRPGLCDENEACLCLCNDPKTIKIEDKNYLQHIQTTLNHDETIPSSTTIEKEEYNSDYIYRRGLEDTERLIECKKTQCRSMGNIQFYTPMSGAYYKEGATYYFENGFAIYRRGEGKETKSFPAIPASLPITIAKIKGGDIAVCINSDCVAQLPEKSIP